MLFGVGGIFGHPAAAVVAQGLAHEGEFGLVVAGNGNAGGVDLRKAGVTKEGTATVGAPDGGGVGSTSVGGEVVNVAVAAGGQDDGVPAVAGDLAADEVAGHDAAGFTVNDNEFQHFCAGEHLDGAQADLTAQSRVGTKQELLTSLPAGIERARDLRAAEGAVGEHSAVFAGEWHALRGALVNDVNADFSEAIDVGLAGTEIAALDGVVKQAVDAVAVVLVIFCGVDSALRCDGVSTARGILEAEAGDLVAEFGEGGGRRGAGQARADDDNVVFAFVSRGDEADGGFVFAPLFGQWSCGSVGFECHSFTPEKRVVRWQCGERYIRCQAGLSRRPRARRLGRQPSPSRSAARRRVRLS